MQGWRFEAARRGLGLVAASLLVACGSRSTLLDTDRSAPEGAGVAGMSSAPRLKSWDRIAWDEPSDEVPAYLWTGSVNDTWAVLSAGPSPDGSFY
ncbi:MAG TPA: hypothetical protein VEQ59_20155, partial [Polyangiaceae bacterium]|nr:hypothetical protein [Polyangiaceae bacterium]